MSTFNAEQFYWEEVNKKYKKGCCYHIIKRFIDIVGSLVGIVLLSPIFLITMIAIKADSKGAIFFSQKRVGKEGKIFKMYKFRSMVMDAENQLEKLKDKNEMTGPMFKIKEDPRITRVGKFIRKTSIDEIPQFFNVLSGEMSLVGPRPNLEKEVLELTPYEKQKLCTKPGLTCYWQVMGRSTIDFKQWMELDIKYLRERSTWVDIKLIFKTARVLFGDKNAR